MQDAGDSPPTGNAARGGKGSAFPPLTASVRTGKGIGLRSAEPRSRCGVSEQRLTQRFAPRNRRRGLLWWIAPVELRGGAENRNGQEQVQKKTAKKSRSYGGVEFSRGGFGCHPYRQDKTVVVLSPIAGPGISLIASSDSRNGLYGKLQTLLSSSGLFRPPGSGSLFRFQAAAPVSSPGSDLLIRSPPGPGIIRRAAPARARRHQRHRLPESRPAAWRRVPRTRSRAPAASRRPS